MTNLLKGDNIRAILDHPLLFNGARDILAGSQATTHELVGRYIGEDRPTLVLDIGCGTGDFSVHSTSYYVGLDKNRHLDRKSVV